MAGRKFVNGTTGVQLHPDRLGMPPGLAQDFYDAYAIARATRELLERGRAAA
jgi:hypothetical protein